MLWRVYVRLSMTNCLFELHWACNRRLFQQLADPVAAALGTITKALNQQERFDGLTSQRRFTIAMTDVGEMYFMPRLVEHSQTHTPDIKIATGAPIVWI